MHLGWESDEKSFVRRILTNGSDSDRATLANAETSVDTDKRTKAMIAAIKEELGIRDIRALIINA